MRALERYILLEIIDERWREHLHDMDYLREGIHLRGFAQIEPIVAYKNDGFEMFQGLINSIWEEFARFIFHVEVEVEGQNGGGAASRPRRAAGRRLGHRRLVVDSTSSYSYQGGAGCEQPSALAAAAAGARARGRSRAPPRTRSDEFDMPAPGRAARAGRGGADRPQRPMLVRLRQEVQEVPWRLAPVASATS